MKGIVKVLGYTSYDGEEGSFTTLNMFYVRTVPKAHNKTLSLCMILYENYGTEMARKGRMIVFWSWYNPISEVIIKMTRSFRKVAKRHPGTDTSPWD